MSVNEIQYLYDIAAIPIEVDEFDAVFPHLVDYAIELFSIEAAVLYIENRGKLVFHASMGMKHITLPHYLPDPDETVQNRGQAKPRPFAHDMPAAGLSLRIGQERLGWLYVARKQDFSEVEARLLAVFAERVAIMLHHAHTQELIQLEREQRKLAHTLHDISLILTSRHSFRQILEQILAQVARVLPYDAASVWLMGDDGLERMACGVGYDKFNAHDKAKNLVLSPDKSPILHEIMTSKRALVISEIHKDKRWHLKQEYYWIQSWASAPILINDEFVGQFNVLHTQKNFYGDAHIPILESLAQLISIAAQNAQVFDGMRQALTREKELNTLKSRFVSTISHEFRTPLTAISTYSQILEKYDAKLDVHKRRNYFGKIRGQIKYLNALIEDVLVLGKSDAIGLEFNPNMDGLIAFCEDIVSETRLFAPSNLRFIFEQQGDGFDTLFDGKLLRHILLNLLSNAIKYSPDGGTIRFLLDASHKEITIIIADQGIGIPDEEQQNLFQSFFRASNVDELPGTGLGLAIVKRAVDAYHGKINVQSCPKNGTKFIITLPYIAAAVAK
ncbi:MAG: ATP-binding protein [Anaerolineae bacterium]|nr:ATP-binding protein [Anaerolineae bacterium]